PSIASEPPRRTGAEIAPGYREIRSSPAAGAILGSDDAEAREELGGDAGLPAVDFLLREGALGRLVDEVQRRVARARGHARSLIAVLERERDQLRRANAVDGRGDAQPGHRRVVGDGEIDGDGGEARG